MSFLASQAATLPPVPPGHPAVFTVAADRYLDLRGTAATAPGTGRSGTAPLGLPSLYATCLEVERERRAVFDTGLVHIFVDADHVPGLRTMRALAPALNVEEQMMVRAVWLDRIAVRLARDADALRRATPPAARRRRNAP